MNLRQRLEAEHHRLTPSERDLAAFMLANEAQLAFESASSIARKTGVSAATAVRLFAKIGYDSFRDVQDELRGAVAAKLSSPVDRIAASGASSSLPSVIARSMERDRAGIAATLEALDRDKLAALAERIARGPGRVYLIGGRYSFAAAHYLFSHLNLCREGIVLVDSAASMIGDQLMWATKQDLLLCLSVRRYAQTSLAAARHFRALGADVAAITDSPLSPISRHATSRFLVEMQSTAIFDSYAALFSLVHALIQAVAVTVKRSLPHNIRKVEALWAEHQIFDL